MDNLSNPVLLKRKKLTKKIVKEHFDMTLSVDKALNYLWFMYYKGLHKGTFKPFMLLMEMNLLLSLDIINEDERDSLKSMFLSEDEDNYYLGLLSLETLRNKRIKIHGEWTEKIDVSDEFKEVVSKYPVVLKFEQNHKLSAK